MRIELIPENPQKDLGVVRIEIVRIFKTDEDYELTGGAQKFGVIDLEVYEVKSI